MGWRQAPIGSHALRREWLRVAVHVGALAPLGLLVWRFEQGDLGVNPIETITYVTGKSALVLLMLALACSPARTILGVKQALRARRTLGLYSFGYATLHLLTFVGLDYGFDFGLILREGLVEKPFIVAGFSAYLILLALALTSTKGWMRRLRRRWKRLHRLAYASALLAAVHFLWLVKAISVEPAAYAALVGLLLALRIPPVSRAVRRDPPRRAQ